MGVAILAPDDVNPGHMMLAPLSINLIAPLSTCTCGNINGSGKKAWQIVGGAWDSTGAFCIVESLTFVD